MSRGSGISLRGDFFSNKRDLAFQDLPALSMQIKHPILGIVSKISRDFPALGATRSNMANLDAELLRFIQNYAATQCCRFDLFLQMIWSLRNRQLPDYSTP